MNDFTEQIQKIQETEEPLENYIWNIFSRYLTAKKILFSSPDSWEYNRDENEIIFRGEDGCMGCYDPMSISIPIKFFIDPEKAFKELEEDVFLTLF